MEDNELYELEMLDTSLDRQCIRGCRDCILKALMGCNKYINIELLNPDVYDGMEEHKTRREANVDNFYNGD